METFPSSSGWKGRLDFNPSRVIDPKGITVCPFESLPEVVERVWSEARTFLVPACDPAAATVTRVDVAADFTGVEHLLRLLLGLAGVHRPNGKTTLGVNPRTDVVSELRAGTKTGGHAILYSKELQSPRHPEAIGVARFEVQARNWAERYAGIRTLADVDEAHGLRLLEDRWEWVGAGTRVVIPPTDLAMLVEHTDWTDAAKSAFVGDQVRKVGGGPVKMSATRRSTFNRRTRSLGAVVASSVPGVPCTVRLDPALMMEVVDVTTLAPDSGWIS